MPTPGLCWFRQQSGQPCAPGISSTRPRLPRGRLTSSVHLRFPIATRTSSFRSRPPETARATRRLAHTVRRSSASLREQAHVPCGLSGCRTPCRGGTLRLDKGRTFSAHSHRQLNPRKARTSRTQAAPACAATPYVWDTLGRLQPGSPYGNGGPGFSRFRRTSRRSISHVARPRRGTNTDSSCGRPRTLLEEVPPTASRSAAESVRNLARGSISSRADGRR
jgi:hypothetical protein